ncbi:MAG: rod shape-determining protein [Patescibacteria group bacterium]|nr:rod shape-determining protein [Patescibacteria group bacterium]MCX7589859.1 rod shape-determining protein [Patescibacteria group bacterium]MDW8279671.1 rod shape-determining protein [bacterium]
MKILNKLFNDIGIDLGTANCLIYIKDRGILINEPTVAAINIKTNQILAVGDDAKKMLGRTPQHINVVRPLVGGVISDFEMSREMLRSFFKKLNNQNIGRWGFRRAVVAIPNDLTEVERKSVEDAVLSSGCSNVYLIESPIVAALGAGLNIEDPEASLIVDIGGGTTDIAVISMRGIVASKTLKIAGDKFNQEIVDFIRDEFKLVIGDLTAENIKIAVGSALPLDEKLEMIVRGRDLQTGLPKEILIKNSQIRIVLARLIKQIIESIIEVIEKTPPELVGDMLDKGIFLCGGGALLRGLDEVIQKEIGIESKIVNEPLMCVARGLGKVIDEFENYKNILTDFSLPPQIKL